MADIVIGLLKTDVENPKVDPDSIADFYVLNRFTEAQMHADKKLQAYLYHATESGEIIPWGIFKDASDEVNVFTPKLESVTKDPLGNWFVPSGLCGLLDVYPYPMPGPKGLSFLQSQSMEAYNPQAISLTTDAYFFDGHSRTSMDDPERLKWFGRAELVNAGDHWTGSVITDSTVPLQAITCPSLSKDLYPHPSDPSRQVWVYRPRDMYHNKSKDGRWLQTSPAIAYFITGQIPYNRFIEGDNPMNFVTVYKDNDGVYKLFDIDNPPELK